MIEIAFSSSFTRAFKKSVAGNADMGLQPYCEVALSGVNPEEFGKKYPIPTYFR